jgi:hypothetical protein
MADLIENIRKQVRLLDWECLKSILDTLPPTEERFDQIALIVWHSDSMVRRRPGDDGVARDLFLKELGAYYQARGVVTAKELIGEMHVELLKIDKGYVEIHSVVPKMVSAKFNASQRIAGVFSALDHAILTTFQDFDKKVELNKGVIGPDRNLRDAADNSYDPHAVIHGLTVAAGDVLMLESFTEGWFDDRGKILLPDLQPAPQGAPDAVVANLMNANKWRIWKNVDERVRFLGGSLVLHSQDYPDWVGKVKSENPGVEINTVFEFKPDSTVEQFEVLANERFDSVVEQNLHKLIRTTNVEEKISSTRNLVALPPHEFISLDEALAAVSFGHLTKMDIMVASAGGMLLSERLRGYSILKLLTEELKAEQGTYFPRVSRQYLIVELCKSGLNETVAEKFIQNATFGKSSRDLYDQPLIKSTDDHYFVFGVSLALADFTKILISSLANERQNFECKGEAFEEFTISMLKSCGFNARKLKVKRGLKNEHEFDYDVAFTWDDHVFFIECKNRGIPMGNPIATYHFNQEMQGHVKQVERLRQGLNDYPDILEKDFPAAAGKTPVFCIVNALPYSMGEFKDIYVIDDSILGRFFSSSTFTVTMGRRDGKGPQIQEDLRMIWSGMFPSAKEFIDYISSPPQLALAVENYALVPKLEQLSLDSFAAIIDFRRKDLNAEAISRNLRE